MLNLAEQTIFRRDYDPLKNRFVSKSRMFLLWEILQEQFFSHHKTLVIYGFIYIAADERTILPIIRRIATRADCKQRNIKAHLVTLKPIDANIQTELMANGCQVDRHLPSILKLCVRPQNKVGLFCLDQRDFYQHHGIGVDIVDTVRKFGVRTASIQHGGTRRDAVQGLASSASDTILVWGKRVARELRSQYQIPPERIKVVGNPLHDRLSQINPAQVLEQLQQIAPAFYAKAQGKKVVLLGSCLHSEYVDRANEAEAYQQYIEHLYQSLDFSRVCLIVKMHPVDTIAPSLYQTYLPETVKATEQVLILEPSQIDIYSLLSVCDLLVTRASTVAEEALMLEKPVIAFDLDQSGPASAYLHLKEYGQFQIVYQSPSSALREAVLNAIEAPATHIEDLTAELTYKLDGHSCDRAVDALLDLLQASDVDRTSSPKSFSQSSVAS